jgi:hypothetical protein
MKRWGRKKDRESEREREGGRRGIRNEEVKGITYCPCKKTAVNQSKLNAKHMKHKTHTRQIHNKYTTNKINTNTNTNTKT